MDRATFDKGVFRFGSFVLDPFTRRLTCHGRPIRLTARPFDLLMYAVENAGREISKDELITAVWGDRAVEEANLTQAVFLVRRTIQQAGGDDPFVTLPGRGYRIVANVTREAAASAGLHIAAPAKSREEGFTAPSSGSDQTVVDTLARRIAAAPALKGVTAVVLAMITFAGTAWITLNGERAPRDPVSPPRLSIVILPFRNLSGDHGRDYLADAISDDLITGISQMPGSLVIARKTADAYRAANIPAAQISRELDVRYVLDGALQAANDGLHINAQLVDAEHNTAIWVDHFDVAAGHLGDVQAAIEGRVESSLAVELTRIESARSWHDKPRNPDALDLYMRAMSLLNRSEEPAAIRQAQTMLEKAVSLQPGFADANAALSWALLSQNHVSPDDLKDAQRAVANALASQPDNVVALSSRAGASLLLGRLTEAEHDARAALALDPNKPEALEMLAAIGYYTNRSQDAVSNIHALLVRDPKNRKVPLWLELLGLAYIEVGQYDHAIEAYQQAQTYIGRSLPDSRSPWNDLGLISANALAGNIDTAKSLCKAYLRRHPTATIWKIATANNKSYPLSNRFGRFDTGLRLAGLPDFADEHAPPEAIPPAGEGSNGLGMRGHNPGATVVDTKRVQAMRASNPDTVIVDAGAGLAVPEGAIWAWSDQDPSAPDRTVEPLVAAVARHARSGKQAPLVIMGDGPDSALPPEAVSRLVQDGYANVVWYRGGEQSWAQAALPARDLRP